MKKIYLTKKGHYTIVDDDDFELFSRWKWDIHPYGYVIRSEYLGRSGGKSKLRTHRMHRDIVKCPTGMQVDHINGDKLDNRKSNLRICTNAQNQMNRPGIKNKTSQYKGVSWNKAMKKWEVCISKNNKNIYLGCFSDEKEAALSYDLAAKEIQGDYAWLNFSNSK